MIRLKQIFARFGKETTRGAKRTPDAVTPFMHEQMKRVLQQNYQRIITSK